MLVLFLKKYGIVYCYTHWFYTVALSVMTMADHMAGNLHSRFHVWCMGCLAEGQKDYNLFSLRFDIATKILNEWFCHKKGKKKPLKKSARYCLSSSYGIGFLGSAHAGLTTFGGAVIGRLYIYIHKIYQYKVSSSTLLAKNPQLRNMAVRYTENSAAY